MRAWSTLTRSALYRLDPETAHHFAIWALEHGIGGADREADDPVLKSELLGLTFGNPIGLAAGFDKDARALSGALGLGFGFVEAGTVTPLAQPGNPKPRLFRLDEDRAVINRFGFNSRGLSAFRGCLTSYRKTAKGRGIIGANVGKNRDTSDAASDYVIGIADLTPLADYLVVNLSSPNTPGLRALQARDPITDLLQRVVSARNTAAGTARRPPLFAKVGPDLTDGEIADIADAALGVGIDGLIIGNTTVSRPAGLTSKWRDEGGGLSGMPLMPLATGCLAKFYRRTAGRIPLIGCGGVASGADAYAKIKAGASLVQCYSALVFEGPPLIPRIKKELAQLLQQDGFSSVAEAVGIENAVQP